ncbi:MAG: ribonuclease HI [Archangiaceae bacterium]|nr:ribonuclease HI [Archangiaceae bacterium]
MADAGVVVIHTDGACRGNPGPGGWGAVLRYGSNMKELWGSETETTNNRMELTAVISALHALTRPSKVQVFTDSSYVQQGISKWVHGWKKNGWKTSAKEPVKNEDLWRALDQLASLHQVEWRWVKGHAGDAGNEHADALANRGIDELLTRVRS